MQKMKIFSEKDLSERLKEGDRAAWKTIYERYSGQFFAVCLRYVADSEAAQDVLHDAFLKIFNSARKFPWNGNGSFKAWMTKIVLNSALEFLRKRKNADTFTDLENVEQIAEDEGKAEMIPAETLYEYIRQLPDGYRTIFNLFAVEGKSHKEIAALLGISEQTSASQYHRARMKLMAKINSYVKDNE